MIDDTGLPVSARPESTGRGLRARREQHRPAESQQQPQDAPKGANSTLDTQRATEARRIAMSHVLEPLRVMEAIAPSGAHAWLRKYTESDRELSFGCGSLTAVEYGQFWSAKLRAERPGLDRWNEAIGILERAGFRLAEARPERKEQ